MADLAGRTVTGGRLNAFKALGGDIIPPPPAVMVTPEDANVIIGGSVQFSASGGNPPYVWSVIDSSIGSVPYSSGLANNPGRATINASAVY